MIGTSSMDLSIEEDFQPNSIHKDREREIERERERERKRERKREATISYDCHVVAKKAYRGSEKMGNTLCDEI